jgi:hypothetical protein
MKNSKETPLSLSNAVLEAAFYRALAGLLCVSVDRRRSGTPSGTSEVTPIALESLVIQGPSRRRSDPKKMSFLNNFKCLC